jgi:glycosyltransferase involved in cell wall biosynthesis
MKIIAVLAVRNERKYLANCLMHLIDNGIEFAVIDNESSDDTRALLETSPFREHLVDYVMHPYPGYFDWQGLMKAREDAALRSGADWVLFVSADEIMHSYQDGESLSEAIARVANTGVDVIDFNEFVFLPVERDYQSDIRGYQDILHYYFFEPTKPRLMRARRRNLNVSHLAAGGHTLSGEDFILSAESFVLRHYIFSDQGHALEKYTNRVFSKDEIALGWHGNRVGMEVESFMFPAVSKLQCLDRSDQKNLDRTDIKKTHYWQWPR